MSATFALTCFQCIIYFLLLFLHYDSLFLYDSAAPVLLYPPPTHTHPHTHTHAQRQMTLFCFSLTHALSPSVAVLSLSLSFLLLCTASCLAEATAVPCTPHFIRKNHIISSSSRSSTSCCNSSHRPTPLCVIRYSNIYPLRFPSRFVSPLPSACVCTSTTSALKPPPITSQPLVVKAETSKTVRAANKPKRIQERVQTLQQHHCKNSNSIFLKLSEPHTLHNKTTQRMKSAASQRFSAPYYATLRSLAFEYATLRSSAPYCATLRSLSQYSYPSFLKASLKTFGFVSAVCCDSLFIAPDLFPSGGYTTKSQSSFHVKNILSKASSQAFVSNQSFFHVKRLWCEKASYSHLSCSGDSQFLSVDFGLPFCAGAVHTYYKSYSASSRRNKQISPIRLLFNLKASVDNISAVINASVNNTALSVPALTGATLTATNNTFAAKRSSITKKDESIQTQTKFSAIKASLKRTCTSFPHISTGWNMWPPWLQGMWQVSFLSCRFLSRGVNRDNDGKEEKTDENETPIQREEERDNQEGRRTMKHMLPVTFLRNSEKIDYSNTSLPSCKTCPATSTEEPNNVRQNCVSSSSSLIENNTGYAVTSNPNYDVSISAIDPQNDLPVLLRAFCNSTTASSCSSGALPSHNSNDFPLCSNMNVLSSRHITTTTTSSNSSSCSTSSANSSSSTVRRSSSSTTTNSSSTSRSVREGDSKGTSIRTSCNSQLVQTSPSSTATCYNCSGLASNISCSQSSNKTTVPPPPSNTDVVSSSSCSSMNHIIIRRTPSYLTCSTTSNPSEPFYVQNEWWNSPKKAHSHCNQQHRVVTSLRLLTPMQRNTLARVQALIELYGVCLEPGGKLRLGGLQASRSSCHLGGVVSATEACASQEPPTAAAAATATSLSPQSSKTFEEDANQANANFTEETVFDKADHWRLRERQLLQQHVKRALHSEKRLQGKASCTASMQTSCQQHIHRDTCPQQQVQGVCGQPSRETPQPFEGPLQQSVKSHSSVSPSSERKSLEDRHQKQKHTQGEPIEQQQEQKHTQCEPIEQHQEQKHTQGEPIEQRKHECMGVYPDKEEQRYYQTFNQSISMPQSSQGGGWLSVQSCLQLLDPPPCDRERKKGNTHTSLEQQQGATAEPVVVESQLRSLETTPCTQREMYRCCSSQTEEAGKEKQQQQIEECVIPVSWCFTPATRRLVLLFYVPASALMLRLSCEVRRRGPATPCTLYEQGPLCLPRYPLLVYIRTKMKRTPILADDSVTTTRGAQEYEKRLAGVTKAMPAITSLSSDSTSETCSNTPNTSVSVCDYADTVSSSKYRYVMKNTQYNPSTIQPAVATLTTDLESNRMIMQPLVRRLTTTPLHDNKATMHTKLGTDADVDISRKTVTDKIRQRCWRRVSDGVRGHGFLYACAFESGAECCSNRSAMGRICSYHKIWPCHLNTIRRGMHWQQDQPPISIYDVYTNNNCPTTNGQNRQSSTRIDPLEIDTHKWPTHTQHRQSSLRTNFLDREREESHSWQSNSQCKQSSLPVDPLDVDVDSHKRAPQNQHKQPSVWLVDPTEIGIVDKKHRNGNAHQPLGWSHHHDGVMQHSEDQPKGGNFFGMKGQLQKEGEKVQKQHQRGRLLKMCLLPEQAQVCNVPTRVKRCGGMALLGEVYIHLKRPRVITAVTRTTSPPLRPQHGFLILKTRQQRHAFLQELRVLQQVQLQYLQQHFSSATPQRSVIFFDIDQQQSVHQQQQHESLQSPSQWLIHNLCGESQLHADRGLCLQEVSLGEQQQQLPHKEQQQQPQGVQQQQNHEQQQWHHQETQQQQHREEQQRQHQEKQQQQHKGEQQWQQQQHHQGGKQRQQDGGWQQQQSVKPAKQQMETRQQKVEGQNKEQCVGCGVCGSNVKWREQEPRVKSERQCDNTPGHCSPDDVCENLVHAVERLFTEREKEFYGSKRVGSLGWYHKHSIRTRRRDELKRGSVVCSRVVRENRSKNRRISVVTVAVDGKVVGWTIPPPPLKMTSISTLSGSVRKFLVAMKERSTAAADMGLPALLTWGEEDAAAFATMKDKEIDDNTDVVPAIEEGGARHANTGKEGFFMTAEQLKKEGAETATRGNTTVDAAKEIAAAIDSRDVLSAHIIKEQDPKEAHAEKEATALLRESAEQNVIGEETKKRGNSPILRKHMQISTSALNACVWQQSYTGPSHYPPNNAWKQAALTSSDVDAYINGTAIRRDAVVAAAEIAQPLQESVDDLPPQVRATLTTHARKEGNTIDLEETAEPTLRGDTPCGTACKETEVESAASLSKKPHVGATRKERDFFSVEGNEKSSTTTREAATNAKRLLEAPKLRVQCGLINTQVTTVDEETRAKQILRHDIAAAVLHPAVQRKLLHSYPMCISHAVYVHPTRLVNFLLHAKTKAEAAAAAA